MEHLKTILPIILLAALVACEPPVTFTAPQPEGRDNLAKFPKKVQGIYRSLSDSSKLTIIEKAIIRTYDFYYKFHPSLLDSTTALSTDSIIHPLSGKKVQLQWEGDSLKIHVYWTDTMFQINYDNVLRKLKGLYFLNTRYNEASWEVRKMQLSKGQLNISEISNEQDLRRLNEITIGTYDSTASYNITITKRQFKKFVRNDGFEDKEFFVKLGNP